MNNQELERFEKDLYQQEKEEFLSDKCIHCMEYVNSETEKCDNGLCSQYYEESPILDDSFYDFLNPNSNINKK